MKVVRLKVAKIEDCQNLKMPKFKVAKIENCQNWKLSKLKIVKIESCRNWRLPKLKIVAKLETCDHGVKSLCSCFLSVSFYQGWLCSHDAWLRRIWLSDWVSRKSLDNNYKIWIM